MDKQTCCIGRLGGRARPWPRPRPPGARGAERLRMGGEEKEEDGAGVNEGQTVCKTCGNDEWGRCGRS